MNDFLLSQTHPAKARLVAVCRAVWPNFDERSDLEAAGLMGQVDDVLRGVGSPWLSRVEREKVKAAADKHAELGS